MKIDNSERGLRLAQSAAASIQGSAGSTAAFNLISGLTVGLLLSDSQSLDVLESSGWNARCLPPWSQRELIDKIRRSRTESRREPGYLLNATGTGKGNQGNGNKPYGYMLRDPRQIHTNSTPATLPPRSAKNYSPAEMETKAAQRAKWENPIAPTFEHIEAVSHLRHSSRESVEEMVLASLMHFEFVFDYADSQKHLCFVIVGEDFRQARRLDGIQLTNKEGNRIKSKNLPGSLATGFVWKPSPDAARNPILLLEGVAGYLEALTALRWAGPYPNRWEVMAAHSANASRFCNVPDILSEISGRRVRIIQDSDPSGRAAALAWGQELTAAGCQVELVTLPPGMKDIGDVLKAEPKTYHPELAAILAL